MNCQDLMSMKNKNKYLKVSSAVGIGASRVHMGDIPDPHIASPFAKDFFLSKYCRTDILNGTYISAKPTPEIDNGIIGAAPEGLTITYVKKGNKSYDICVHKWIFYIFRIRL